MSLTPSALHFLKSGTRTAGHFGFQDLERLKKSAAEHERPEDKPVPVHKASANDRRIDALHGMLTSGVCAYIDNELYRSGEPALFYTVGTVPRTGDTALSLQVVGVEKSIAETLLIQTTRAILEDLGYEEQLVRINSLGDAESTARYIRELTNYLRKRIEDLPAPARELMKEHVFSALNYLVEKEHELGMRSPSPLEYLSDPSRKHFRGIVEFLEMSEARYEIDPRLLGHDRCYSEALFSVEPQDERAEGEEAPIFVRGGRYNAFVSTISKTEVSAAGAVMVLRGKKSPKNTPQVRTKKPSVFVVQLGFGPKIRSLLLVSELRRAGVAVLQDVVSDSLQSQLQKAEGYGAKYAVIIGQKEYVEGNVILRNLGARSQEHLPISTLASYLKRATK